MVQDIRLEIAEITLNTYIIVYSNSMPVHKTSIDNRIKSSSC